MTGREAQAVDMEEDEVKEGEDPQPILIVERIAGPKPGLQLQKERQALQARLRRSRA